MRELLLAAEVPAGVLVLASTLTLPDGTQWILAALGAMWLLRGMLAKSDAPLAVHTSEIAGLKAAIAALGVKLDTLLGGHASMSTLRRDVDELRADVDEHDDRIHAIQLGCAVECAPPQAPTESATHVKGTTGQRAAVVEPRRRIPTAPGGGR